MIYDTRSVYKTGEKLVTVDEIIRIFLNTYHQQIRQCPSVLQGQRFYFRFSRKRSKSRDIFFSQRDTSFVESLVHKIQTETQFTCAVRPHRSNKPPVLFTPNAAVTPGIRRSRDSGSHSHRTGHRNCISPLWTIGGGCSGSTRQSGSPHKTTWPAACWGC